MGFEYDTYCVNSPLYRMTLMRKFLINGGINGGKTVTKDLVNELGAFRLAGNVVTVINASGMGFGDPASFAIRGQTCLVANPCSMTITRQNADGSWTFIIPRPLGGGTVIGGTKDQNDWEAKPSAKTRERLLVNGKEIFPGDELAFDVVTDIVRRRPGRTGGMRIEVERKIDANGHTKPIVHAYGAGGRRYEIIWGVANEVLSFGETDSLVC